MEKSTCYILSGIPGSGKSTWARNFMRDHQDWIYISRDEIRFSLLDDDDDYFAHEELVLTLYHTAIQEAVSAGKNIIVDATHVSKRPIHKTLNSIPLSKYNVVLVSFHVPLEICLARNAQRKGRACVPTETIKDMYKSKRKLDAALADGVFSSRLNAIKVVEN